MEITVIDDEFNYVRGSKIGCGSFGVIYEGRDKDTDEKVAMKLEHLDLFIPQLEHEAKLYKILQGEPGIANMKWFGVDGNRNVLVMDLLGKNLEELFTQNERKMSLKSVLMLADQMISRIEYIHSKSYTHRDIKPSNFLMGRKNHKNEVYIADFGLAKEYRNPSTRQHIEYREDNGFFGSLKFCSFNALRGIEQSRRDDLESLGYVLIYFLKGSLPWEHVTIGRFNAIKRKHTMITRNMISIEDLCDGIPQEFAIYLNYCRNLGFEDNPDYGYLRRMFRTLFSRQRYKMDYIFDWTIWRRTKPKRVIRVSLARGPYRRRGRDTSGKLVNDSSSNLWSTRILQTSRSLLAKILHETKKILTTLFLRISNLFTRKRKSDEDDL